jgi:hypothetical protein
VSGTDPLLLLLLLPPPLLLPSWNAGAEQLHQQQGWVGQEEQKVNRRMQLQGQGQLLARGSHRALTLHAPTCRSFCCVDLERISLQSPNYCPASHDNYSFSTGDNALQVLLADLQ